MELIILLVVVIGVLGWFLWRDHKFEESGSHPLDGATKSPEPWPFPTSRPAESTTKPDGIGHESIPIPVLTSVLDVNKDGQVDIKDAVAAAEVVVKKTKKTAVKAKESAKKTVAKAKTAVQKTASKKPKSK
jgi:hypothetical protein